ncbi:MAG: hypothetical protein QM724_00710 [Flavobacteriales bacterium]
MALHIRANHSKPQKPWNVETISHHHAQRLSASVGGKAYCTVLYCSTARAQTADLYTFTSGVGTTLDPMSGATNLIGPNQTYATSGVQGIGFTFHFAETDYTQYSVNENGCLRLGSTVITGFGINTINANTSYDPKVGAFVAQGMTTAIGAVSTVLTGSAPNRIRVIQWNTYVGVSGDTPNCLFQLWLYEGSNVIQCRYGTGAPALGGWSGIRDETSYNYLNVRPGPTVSSSNATALGSWPGDGVLFTFTPPAPRPLRAIPWPLPRAYAPA